MGAMCDIYYGSSATMRDFHSHWPIILEQRKAQLQQYVHHEIPKLVDFADVYGPISLYEVTEFNNFAFVIKNELINDIQLLERTMHQMDFLYKRGRTNNHNAIALFVEMNKNFDQAKNRIEGLRLYTKSKTGVQEDERIEF